MDDEAEALGLGYVHVAGEGRSAVHGMKPEAVHFHESARWTAFLDICMACVLFTRISPARFVVSLCPLRTVRSFAPTASYPFRLLRCWNCLKAFPSVRSPARAKP